LRFVRHIIAEQANGTDMMLAQKLRQISSILVTLMRTITSCPARRFAWSKTQRRGMRMLQINRQGRIGICHRYLVAGVTDVADIADVADLCILPV
jgi:hypothetical protein